jgi:hypothetical protein
MPVPSNSLICESGCFLVTRICHQSLARNLPTIYDQIKNTKSEMLKIVGIGINGAENVSVVYHGKKETFRYTPHDSLIDQE